jgi:hypothetical protein
MAMAPVCAKAINVVKKTGIIQAGLVCQGYIPEKHNANQAANSHFKQCISCIEYNCTTFRHKDM